MQQVVPRRCHGCLRGAVPCPPHAHPCQGERETGTAPRSALVTVRPVVACPVVRLARTPTTARELTKRLQTGSRNALSKCTSVNGPRVGCDPGLGGHSPGPRGAPRQAEGVGSHRGPFGLCWPHPVVTSVSIPIRSAQGWGQRAEQPPCTLSSHLPALLCPHQHVPRCLVPALLCMGTRALVTVRCSVAWFIWNTRAWESELPPRGRRPGFACFRRPVC